MLKKNEKKFKFYFLLIMLILAIPQLFFRLKHPEMTETQLFINFFQAYKEFLWNG